MHEISVTFKLNNKLYFGAIDPEDDSIDHFNLLLMNNAKEFKDNIFYITMVGDGDRPDLTVLDYVKCNFSSLNDDGDFLILANSALRAFKLNTTIH